jgi:hypothetical protein
MPSARALRPLKTEIKAHQIVDVPAGILPSGTPSNVSEGNTPVGTGGDGTAADNVTVAVKEETADEKTVTTKAATTRLGICNQVDDADQAENVKCIRPNTYLVDAE